jgi:vanillate O-demethylase ferredoxin subunit
MSPAFRKSVLVAHRWTGLTLGIIIAVLAITASFLVFKPQLEPAVSGELFAAATTCTTPLPLDDRIAAAARYHLKGKVDDVQLPGNVLEPTVVRFFDRAMVYVDPCTARVVGERNKYLGLFGLPEQIHRFKFIAGEPGTLADGFITLFFLVLLIVGGVIVWWPPTRLALRSALKFRPHLKGVAFTLNLHNVVGAYTVIVLLVTAATAMPISFSAVREAFYPLTSSQRISKPASRVVPGARALPLEVAWSKARSLVPGFNNAVLRVPRKPADAIEVFLVAGDAPHPNARSYGYFDQYNGATLQWMPYERTPTGLRLYFWIVSLHTGAVGGPAVQLLFLLGMLGVPVLAYTGFSSYLRRRFGAARLPVPIPVRVERIVAETAEIKSFHLVPASGKALPSFTPGSHISVRVPDGLTRQYSLCNGPREDRVFHIAVKREPDSRGGSRTLHERVTEGDLLEVLPPRNHFPLDKSAKHHLLLAGGIGITPLLSMARHLSVQGVSFQLQYFTRSPRHAAFHELLSRDEFAGKVDFHYALDPDALRIYLHQLLHRRPDGAHLYVCGPRPFMDLVEDIAAATWPPGTVHMEFFSADPAASSAPRLPFEVTLARSKASFTVPAEKTILEVLAERGINVLNSCGQGVCGTCVTGVLEGTPDHRDAFLSDKERKACDKMMLCVSRSCSQKLVLDL